MFLLVGVIFLGDGLRYEIVLDHEWFYYGVFDVLNALRSGKFTVVL